MKLAELLIGYFNDIGNMSDNDSSINSDGDNK